MRIPEFPDFKVLGLEDRQTVREFLWNFQPQTSELTFTNLFIWRQTYSWQWSVDRDWLFLLGEDKSQGLFFLPPAGPSPRQERVLEVLRWLREEKGVALPAMERVDKQLAEELGDRPPFLVEPRRDHFDYLYRSEDLISLKGSKYHAKRNHIHKFLSTVPEYSLEPISAENLRQCVELQKKWCEWRRCEEDMNLLDEWDAVKEALTNYQSLGVQGTTITIGGQVRAFSFGELLNKETAVIHVEKADPEIPSLYPLINQEFCRAYWSGVRYINREQDLGEEGLRKAKLSYYPDHLAEKYRVTLAGP